MCRRVFEFKKCAVAEKRLKNPVLVYRLLTEWCWPLNGLHALRTFNSPSWRAHSLVHALKSNNPDQFIHKAVAGEGNQPFPLWPLPDDRPQTPKLHTSVHLFEHVFVSAWWLLLLWCRTTLQLPVLATVKCHWLSNVSLDKLIHTHVEVSGQTPVEATSCSLQAICIFDDYLCNPVVKQTSTTITNNLQACFKLFQPDKACGFWLNSSPITSAQI